MTCGLAQLFAVRGHRHHANRHQGSAPRRIRFADRVMGNPELDEPPLELLERGFAVDSQGDGVRPRWEVPGGALAGSVDQLRCKNPSREVTPDDTDVLQMGGLNGTRTRGLPGAYPGRSTC